MSIDWKLSELPSAGTNNVAAPEFGLLTYGTQNFGDDIQALAALQLMPRVDTLINRDHIGDAPPVSWPASETKVLMNGWFMGRRSWPPAPYIQPIFTSFHIGQHGYPEHKGLVPKEFMLDPEAIQYYRKWGPIGCRDRSTRELLCQAGIDSYLSGCLTLTLRRPNVDRTDRILFVDIQGDAMSLLRQSPEAVRDRVSFLTHHVGNRSMPSRDRLAQAASLLEAYASAELVVTSRIHCALPCLAFGTSVLFVSPQSDLSRLDGLVEHLRVVHTKEAQIQAESDWYRPEPNLDTHLGMAEKISRYCRVRLKSRETITEGTSVVHLEPPRNPKFEGLSWPEYEYFDKSWKGRIELMARHLPAGARVLDVGCGPRWLQRLRPDLDYFGVDYVGRGMNSLVADLNQREFPDITVQWTFLSGVLEYVRDPVWLIARVAETAPACVLSYCLIDDHPDVQARRDWGWVNHMNMAEISALFTAHDFQLREAYLSPTRNKILVFSRD